MELIASHRIYYCEYTLPLWDEHDTSSHNQTSVLSMANLIKLEGQMHARTATATPAELHELAQQFAAGLPNRSKALRTRAGIKDVVLVTGTTGNYGTHLLEHLLRDDTVQTVYAVNRRGSQAMERQASAFRNKGFDDGLLDSFKFRMVEGNLDAPNLDIEPGLLEEVSDVYHIQENQFLTHAT